MSFYAKHIFPRALEWTLNNEIVRCERREALGQAVGDTLEIGFGTGLNLACYPKAVTKVVGVDPEVMLVERVRQRIEHASMPVEYAQLNASRKLPFADETFDSVVSTFTLCSIDDVASALAEVRRVLKRQGRFLFLEHGRAESAKVARWQDRLNPIQRVIACGCNLNRAIDEIIRQAGLRIENLDRYVMSGSPALMASMYRGTARRAAADDADWADSR